MENKFLDLMVLVEDQKWSVDDYGIIRNEKEQCPICAIVDVLSQGRISYAIFAVLAWTTFVDGGEDTDMADLAEIMEAADWPWPTLRKQLENALHVNSTYAQI